VLLFGKIGDENHLKFLRPLLLHEDYRVQREALNGIYDVGEDHRKAILLSALSK
jgi:HEAT repeat protein